MVDRPLVSTITSLFRGERYLELWLDRLPRQTIFDRTEFIIDHNEPTAKELEIIQGFERDYPGKLVQMVRERVVPFGASWNRCILRSSADLCAIWNVDDLRTPDSLERQVEVFQAHPETDVVASRYKEVCSFPCEQGQLLDGSKCPEEWFSSHFLLGPLFMFRRSLCDRAGLCDEQLMVNADFDLAIRFSYHGKIRWSPGLAGYFLNERQGLSTRSRSRTHIEDTVVKLRYGIFESLDFLAVPLAVRKGYHVGHLRIDGRMVPVSRYLTKAQPLLALDAAGRAAKGVRNLVNEDTFLNLFYPSQWGRGSGPQS